jgi:hypothetical protein
MKKLRGFAVAYSIIAAVVALGLSGCATTPDTGFKVSTRIGKDAPKVEAPSYLVVCASPEVQRTLAATPVTLAALHTRLGELGYVKAASPADAVYMVWVGTGTTNRTVAGVPSAQAVANPNSVRFQNVAATSPGMRYQPDRTDDPSDMMVNPEGELVGTGQLGQRMRTENAQTIEVRESVEYLVLQAWNISKKSADQKPQLVWEVNVSRSGTGDAANAPALLAEATKNIRTQ